jgi:DNA-binding LacI/PurR family transcriptional regulator
MNATSHPKLPKYIHLAENLRSRIDKGALKSGDQLPSLAQLNAEFGASQATVDRAHAILERDGLIVRAQGRGVFVAEPTRRTPLDTLGCALPPPLVSLRYPYYARLMDGIRVGAATERMEVLLLNDLPSAGWEKVDGALLFGESRRDIPQRLPMPMPIVSLMVKLPGHASVVADDYQGAREATKHLIALGHKSIACLTDGLFIPENTPIAAERIRGYRDAMAAAKIKVQKDWMISMPPCPAEFLERGREDVLNWWRSGGDKSGCTAMLCHNDRTAIGVVEALGSLGVRVPDDMSVIGFDSTDECDLCAPRLTSVRVPLQEIGELATKMLVKLIREEELAEVEVVLPTKLEVRGSTARAGS